MSSPAQFLLDFFNSDWKSQQGRAFAPLYDATRALEEELAALQIVGARVSPFLPLLGTIRTELNRRCTNELDKIFTFSGDFCTLEPSDMALLELAVDRTATQPTFTEDRKASIRKLLEQIRTLVTEDESLDPQLRLYISRSIVGVQLALDEHEVTGDFALQEALIRLIGLFRVAEADSAASARWQAAWQEYGAPTVAGFIASIPQLALSAATLMATLGQ